MKILLTNDDGYKAHNIQKMYEELSKDHDVWIVAPKNNCSGMSAAISYLGEIEVTKVDDKIYAVDGTPADCTYLGILSIVDFEFDIALITHDRFWLKIIWARPPRLEAPQSLPQRVTTRM